MTALGPMPRLPRRTFLGLSAWLAAACGRPAAGRATTAAAPLARDEEWEGVRALFPLARDWIHLSTFLLSPHPKPVADAIERYRCELDANPSLVVESEYEHQGRTTRARRAAAEYLGVAPDEIALTDSTTMGLATLYNGLRLGPGDEILTTTHDHYSTHESLRLAAARTGATVRKVPLYEQGARATEGHMVGALAGAVGPRTKLVAITWVHSSTGVKVPVRAIADALGQKASFAGAPERPLLAVDGVHGVGVEDETAAGLGCDFLVSGCHKWLYGPRGTGFVWGRREAWRDALPTIPPFFGEWWRVQVYGGTPPPIDGWVMSPGGFKAFEHYWAIPEAFELHRKIGKARVQARIHELNRHMKEGLGAMRHVTLHTPLSEKVSSGIVCFEVAGMTPEAVVQKLRASRVLASVTPYNPPLARVAASLATSHADVEAGLRALRALA